MHLESENKYYIHQEGIYYKEQESADIQKNGTAVMWLKKYSSMDEENYHPDYETELSGQVIDQEGMRYLIRLDAPFKFEHRNVWYTEVEADFSLKKLIFDYREIRLIQRCTAPKEVADSLKALTKLYNIVGGMVFGKDFLPLEWESLPKSDGNVEGKTLVKWTHGIEMSLEYNNKLISLGGIDNTSLDRLYLHLKKDEIMLYVWTSFHQVPILRKNLIENKYHHQVGL